MQEVKQTRKTFVKSLLGLTSYSLIFSSASNKSGYEKKWGTHQNPSYKFKDIGSFVLKSEYLKKRFKIVNQGNQLISIQKQLENTDINKSLNTFKNRYSKQQVLQKEFNKLLYLIKNESTKVNLKRAQEFEVSSQISLENPEEFAIELFNSLLNKPLPKLNITKIKKRSSRNAFKLKKTANGYNDSKQEEIAYLFRSFIENIFTISHEIGHQINNQFENDRKKRGVFEVMILEEACAYVASFIFLNSINDQELKDVALDYYYQNIEFHFDRFLNSTDLKRQEMKKEKKAHPFAVALAFYMLHRNDNPVQVFSELAKAKSLPVSIKDLEKEFEVISDKELVKIKERVNLL